MRVNDPDIVQRRLEWPLPGEAVYWRIGQTGVHNGKPWATALAYIDARAVRRRLTEILGPAGWQTSMARFADAAGGAGFVCTLRCRIGGEWIERADTSDDTDMEAVKGGASKALVRAAANFGLGEYLYGLGRTYANIVDAGTKGAHQQKGKDGSYFAWAAPALPSWALPKTIPPATQAELCEAGLRCGWDAGEVCSWCLDRYGVALDALELFLADDALAWMADRAKDKS